MTAREQLIERIVQAVIEDDVRHGIATPDEDLDRRCPWYRTNAQAALDAILPQITTVDEFVALPHRTLLVSDAGQATFWSPPTPEDLRKTAAHWLAHAGVWTVVWQPSDGAS